jgi:hypothetical protein
MPLLYLVAFKCCLQTLEKRGSDAWLETIQAIPRHLRMMYMHATQSFFWNAAVSQRVRDHGLTVRAGDIILPEAPWPDGHFGLDGPKPGESFTSMKPHAYSDQGKRPQETSQQIGTTSHHEEVKPVPRAAAATADCMQGGLPAVQGAPGPARQPNRDSCSHLPVPGSTFSVADGNGSTMDSSQKQDSEKQGPAGKRHEGSACHSTGSARIRLGLAVVATQADVDAGTWSIEQLALPLPGGNSVGMFKAASNHLSDLERQYEDAAAAVGVSLGAAPHSLPEFSMGCLTGDMRHAIVRPRAFAYHFVQHRHLDDEIISSGSHQNSHCPVGARSPAHQVSPSVPKSKEAGQATGSMDHQQSSELDGSLPAIPNCITCLEGTEGCAVPLAATQSQAGPPSPQRVSCPADKRRMQHSTSDCTHLATSCAMLSNNIPEETCESYGVSHATGSGPRGTGAPSFQRGAMLANVSASQNGVQGGNVPEAVDIGLASVRGKDSCKLASSALPPSLPGPLDDAYGQPEGSTYVMHEDGTYLSLVMSFALPASSYATMLTRDLLKRSTAVAAHKAASAAHKGVVPTSCFCGILCCFLSSLSVLCSSPADVMLVSTHPSKRRSSCRLRRSNASLKG